MRRLGASSRRGVGTARACQRHLPGSIRSKLTGNEVGEIDVPLGNRLDEVNIQQPAHLRAPSRRLAMTCDAPSPLAIIYRLRYRSSAWRDAAKSSRTMAVTERPRIVCACLLTTYLDESAVVVSSRLGCLGSSRPTEPCGSWYHRAAQASPLPRDRMITLLCPASRSRIAMRHSMSAR